MNRILLVLAALFLWLAPHAKAADSPILDYSTIRGANYVPSYAANTVAIWKNFDPVVIDRELEYAQKIRLNSIRMLLQYVVYEENPEAFIKNVDTFVALCAKRGIRPMLVLFDSCFGVEPDLAKAGESQWVNSPGFSRIQADWKPLEKYAADLAQHFRGDNRLLLWDAMNEPEADFNHPGAAERERILKFCRRICQVLKEKDPTHPVTVGHARVECIPTTMDLVDVLSVHSYAPYRDWFASDIQLARRYGQKSGKPVIVSECGNPAEHQTYEMALDVMEDEKMGFYFWELMIGRVVPFNEMAGLFYPDGTVRDLAPMARLLGFRRKEEGGIPLKQIPNKDFQKKFLETPEQWNGFLTKAAEAPRTKEKILPVLEGVALLALHLDREDDTARQAFIHALSIPNLFKLGRDQEAVESYEKLLELAKSRLKK